MKAKRKEIGWSQGKLAKEANVSAATVSNLEEGNETIGYKDLKRIDKALERGTSDKREE